MLIINIKKNRRKKPRKINSNSSELLQFREVGQLSSSAAELHETNQKVLETSGLKNDICSVHNK